MDMISEHIYSAHNCEIHYWLKRTNAEKWVIFLHGEGMNHHMFDAQCEQLSDNYNVLLWDARGHGLSVPSSEQFSMDLLEEDLLGLMDELQIDAASMIGHGMGGQLAQRMLYEHPENVDSLVLIGCGKYTEKLGIGTRLKMLLQRTFRKLMPWKLLMRKDSKRCGNQKQVRNFAKECFTQMGKKAYLWVSEQVAKSPRYDKEYRIAKPYLYLCGESDRIVNLEKTAKPWAETESMCMFHAIPDAANNANQDNPELVNSYIRQFLNGIGFQNSILKQNEAMH
jgi:pimeloyl-ACP methyl ester carboxylesterase